MRDIERRLNAIEDRAGLGNHPVIFFDWYGSDVTGAAGYCRSWHRMEGEALNLFKARVENEAPHTPGNFFRIIKLTGEEGGFCVDEVL